MDSKPKAQPLPEKLQYAMESLIREATDAKYAVIGIVFSAEPLSVALLRNMKENPVETFRAVTEMLERRAAAGAPTEEFFVPRLS